MFPGMGASSSSDNCGVYLDVIAADKFYQSKSQRESIVVSKTLELVDFMVFLQNFISIEV